MLATSWCVLATSYGVYLLICYFAFWWQPLLSRKTEYTVCLRQMEARCRRVTFLPMWSPSAPGAWTRSHRTLPPSRPKEVRIVANKELYLWKFPPPQGLHIRPANPHSLAWEVPSTSKIAFRPANSHSFPVRLGQTVKLRRFTYSFFHTLTGAFRPDTYIGVLFKSPVRLQLDKCIDNWFISFIVIRTLLNPSWTMFCTW